MLALSLEKNNRGDSESNEKPDQPSNLSGQKAPAAPKNPKGIPITLQEPPREGGGSNCGKGPVRGKRETTTTEGNERENDGYRTRQSLWDIIDPEARGGDAGGDEFFSKKLAKEQGGQKGNPLFG